VKTGPDILDWIERQGNRIILIFSVLIAVMLGVAYYTVVYIEPPKPMTVEERVQLDKLRRKHGYENTGCIYEDWNGKRWYIDQKGRKCEFK
jgi:hypothetical protein